MSLRLRSRLGHLFSREGFRGPVLTLLSGSMIGLGVAYLAQPLLTRLYTPAEFGVYDYFVSVLSVLVPAASLRYEDALMIPERDEEAGHVLWLAASITTCFCLALGLLTTWEAAAAPLLATLGVAALLPWAWLLGPTLLLMRLVKLVELWLARARRFRTITVGDGVSKVLMTLGKAGAGLAGAGTGGLVGAFAGAHVASTVFYTGAALGRRGLGGMPGASWGALRAAAARYRRFPLFSMPAALLNAFAARLPILLLPAFFDLAVVGLFGRAFAAVAVPLSLVGAAVAQVFFVHAAEAHRTGELAGLTRTVHARLVAIGFFPTALLVLAGPDLFAFVFGEPWRAAGLFERYLAPWFFLTAVASPLTRLFDVLERQRADLLLSLGMAAALAVPLAVGGARGDVYLAMGLVGATGAVVRLIHVAAMLRLARVSPAEAAAPYLRYALFSVPGLALVAAVLPAGRPALTTAAAAAAGLLYAGLVLWRDRLLDRR